MPTFLFDDIIFGPVKSRRLGVSLGVNLLPTDNKYCNYNCIYCECGWTPEKYPGKIQLFSYSDIVEALKEKLQKMKDANMLPDAITFAGNGEPTLHRDFAKIIDTTLTLRDQLAPKARIAVLTNGTLAFKKEVFDALCKVDDNIIKLDGGTEDTIRIIDKPLGKFDLKNYIKILQGFKGNLIIQSLFLKGHYKGKIINNATDEEVKKWLTLLEEIRPRLVMLYSIDRDTPTPSLEKVSPEELLQIAKKVEALGISTHIS